MRPFLFFFLGTLLTALPLSADEASRVRVDITFKLSAHCRAGSQIPDPDALGGFATSKNYPQKLTASRVNPKHSADQLILLALPQMSATFQEKYRGFQLLLINRTGKRVALLAQDSTLDIVREARDPNGKWIPIEEMLESCCGNSFHRVRIDPGEFWQFNVPRYQGTFQTQLRFRLKSSRNSAPIYSNIFEGSIHLEQLHGQTVPVWKLETKLSDRSE